MIHQYRQSEFEVWEADWYGDEPFFVGYCYGEDDATYYWRRGYHIVPTQ